MDTRKLSPTEVQRWTRIGALSALAMLLGYLETFVPIPIPGVKLGLANVAVLVELSAGDIGGACWVAATKVLATGLLFGNPVTLAYSLVGTTLALVLMAPLSQLPTMRLEMVSVIGALSHEAGQLVVAQMLLGTSLVWYSAPLLAVAGCVTGVLVGVVAVRTAKLLEAVEQPQEPAVHASEALSASEASGTAGKAALVTIAFVVYVALAMHTTRISLLAVLLAVALVACRARGMTVRQLVRAILPALPIAAITLVAQVATNRQGTVLVTWGRFALTQAAASASAVMLLRLASICMASCFVASFLSQDDVVGLVHRMLGPARRLGLKTQGPELALSTALRLLPLLAHEVEASCLEGATLWSRAFWTDEVPRLVEELYAAARTVA